MGPKTSAFRRAGSGGYRAQTRELAMLAGVSVDYYVRLEQDAI